MAERAGAGASAGGAANSTSMLGLAAIAAASLGWALDNALAKPLLHAWAAQKGHCVQSRSLSLNFCFVAFVRC